MFLLKYFKVMTTEDNKREQMNTYMKLLIESFQQEMQLMRVYIL